MDARGPADDAVVGRGVAASLLGDVSGLADDMLTYLVDRIPEVGGDADLRGLTLGSCSSNLEAVLSMFRHGIDVSAVEAPVTALEHARAMPSTMTHGFGLGAAVLGPVAVSVTAILAVRPAIRMRRRRNTANAPGASR